MNSFTRSISTVMVSYHTGDCLLHAVDAVMLQDGLAQLILVDNGNPPDIMRELRARERQSKRFTLITGHGNIGFARACNLGAAKTDSEYLCLLNPDCLLPDGGLRLMVEVLQAHPEAWLAGPKLCNPDGSEQRGGRRNLLTPHTALGELPLLHRLFPQLLPRLNMQDSPLPSDISPIPAISGACMVMPTKRYRQLGGMDERYFLHVEDLDFCMRVHQEGGVTLFAPGVEVMHQRSSSNASAFAVARHKAKGIGLYFRTHFGRKWLPVVWALQGMILGKGLLRL